MRYFLKFSMVCYLLLFVSCDNSGPDYISAPSPVVTLSVSAESIVLDENISLDISVENLSNIFVNQGPGKFSGIRASLATAKALSFINKIDLYGFNSNQVIDQNYIKIIDLFKKGVFTKNLIKPQY